MACSDWRAEDDETVKWQQTWDADADVIGGHRHDLRRLAKEGEDRLGGEQQKDARYHQTERDQETALHRATDRDRVAGADRLRHQRVESQEHPDAEGRNGDDHHVTEGDRGQRFRRQPADDHGVDHAEQHHSDLHHDDRHRQAQHGLEIVAVR